MKKWGLYAVFILFAYACTWDQPAPTPASEVETTVPSSCIPDSVKLSVELAYLFQYTCSGTLCHSGNTPPGKVNLEKTKAYASMHNGGYINTSNPKESLIYLRMMSTTDPMPPYGNQPKCKTDLLLRWIEQGALDN